MLNMIKYLMSVLVVWFSHVASGSPKYLDIWIFFAVLSTLYSFVWDIKKDWSLGDTRHGFLREKLIYRNTMLYYIGIMVDFCLRCTWVFTLSGGVVNHFDIKRETFKLVIYLLEVIRRCLWNLLRMENEQINQKLDNQMISSFNYGFNPFTPKGSANLHDTFRSSMELSVLRFQSRSSSVNQSLILQ